MPLPAYVARPRV